MNLKNFRVTVPKINKALNKSIGGRLFIFFLLMRALNRSFTIYGPVKMWFDLYCITFHCEAIQ